MASISINIDKRKTTGNAASVRLCISHNNTKVYIPMNIQVDPQYVTKDIHNPILLPHDVHSMDKLAIYSKYYDIITDHVRRCEYGILELTQTYKLDGMTATDIRNYVYGEKEIKIVRHEKKSVLLKERFDSYSASRNSVKYQETMYYTWKLLSEFKEDIDELPINQFTLAMVKDFDLWMTQRGLSISTKGIVFRNIKAVCNDTIDRGLMSADDYPFRKFKIVRKKKTDVEYLTIEQMRQLLALELDNRTGTIGSEFARDVLMISFYCCGANFKDIFNFKKTSGDEIVYIRSKIEYQEPPTIHIKILPELKNLIDKYAGKEHLFDFAERGLDVEAFKHRLNHRYKRISQLIGTNVNLKIIRHTWATLCYQNGTDKSVVNRSLGHVENDVTGIYYIQYDWNMTYKANRAIVDKIQKGE